MFFELLGGVIIFGAIFGYARWRNLYRRSATEPKAFDRLVLEVIVVAFVIWWLW